MPLYTSAVHGCALQLQDPLYVRNGPNAPLSTQQQPVAALRRLGWGTEVHGNRWPAWLHFPLSLESIGPLTVRAVQVRFSTRGGGILTAVHLWDGHERIAFNDRVDVPPLVSSGGNTIRQEARAFLYTERPATPPVINRRAAGISVLWKFATAIEGDVLSAVTFHEAGLLYDAAT